MTCQQCGKEFESKNKHQKYCSCECSYINFRVEQRGWFKDKNPITLTSPVYENGKL